MAGTCRGFASWVLGGSSANPVHLFTYRGVYPRIFKSLRKVCPSHPRSHKFGKVSFVDGRSLAPPSPIDGIMSPPERALW